MWDVVVEAHEIIARRVNGEPSGHSYMIERLEYRAGHSEQWAKRLAVQEAHRRAGVPPWKPYLRESWKHARCTRYMEQIV